MAYNRKEEYLATIKKPKEITDALLETIDYIARARDAELSFDKTIIAEVISLNDASTGEYFVEYQKGKFRGTLPPIDGQRYFSFISQRADGGSVLRWLGDVGRIYRHQEMYSDAVAALAFSEGVPLIDVRRQFLPLRELPQLIAADGIHLTMPGYRRLFDTLAGWVRERL